MLAGRANFILDRAHSAVISLDEGGIVTYWNPSAEQVFGITREEAIGQPVAELIIPERFRDSHYAGIRRFLRDGVGPVLDRRIELAALRADRSEFPVEMTISALKEDEHWSFTAFLQDISERKAGEAERERLTEELAQALRTGERRFDAIVGQLNDAVTIRDRHNTLVYANPAAVKLTGYDSLEALRSAGPDAVMAAYDVLAEDGTPLSMEDIPSVRILNGQPAKPLVVRRIEHASGEEMWQLLKAAPVLDDAGEVEATIMIIEDVSDQKLAERRAAFLAKASDVLASSLDFEQTLRNVAELAVPEVADWCAVDLVDQHGGRRSVAVAHVDPNRLALAEELRSYESDQLDPEQGLGRVFRTGRTEFYPEITDEMLAQAALDDRHLELLREVGFRSALIVPMRAGPKTLGAMTTVSSDSGRALIREDVELAEQIAVRAAVAIENSRLFSERSTIAHTLQQSLLPAQLPEIPGYELASAYMPAMEGSEVGGDFYDAWQVEGGWLIVVGDVAGKGVTAAAVTSLVRHTLRASSEFLTEPAELLAFLDQSLKKQPTPALCTALCLKIAAEGICISVGGHPLPMRVGPTGLEEVGEYGPLLGGFPRAEWSQTAIELQTGEILLAYTDGVTDAIGQDHQRFGLGRLAAALMDARSQPPAGLVETLLAELQKFQVGAQADDTALLALRSLAPHTTEMSTTLNHVRRMASGRRESTSPPS